MVAVERSTRVAMRPLVRSSGQTLDKVGHIARGVLQSLATWLDVGRFGSIQIYRNGRIVGTVRQHLEASVKFGVCRIHDITYTEREVELMATGRIADTVRKALREGGYQDWTIRVKGNGWFVITPRGA